MARASIVFVDFISCRHLLKYPLKLLKAPLNVPQPFVEFFPLELYFGAAPRTRGRGALAEITERRFEFSGAAFFGTGDFHYVRIKKLHLLTLRCNELPPFTMLTQLTDACGSYAGIATTRPTAA